MVIKIAEKTINQIEANVKKCQKIKTISAEEFVILFDDKFTGCCAVVSSKGGFLDTEASFKGLEIVNVDDNKIYFTDQEVDRELSYSFFVNLSGFDRIDHIEMIETGLGSKFVFNYKNGGEVVIDAMN